MNKDKRVIKNELIIKSIYNFLEDIINNPNNYNNEKENLIKILKSQGSLSKYEDKSVGIEKTSLNTLKRISPNVINGGFEELNKKRILALKSLKNTSNNNKKTNKDYLKIKIKEQEDKILELQNAEFLLLQGLTKNLQLLKEISNNKNLKQCNNLAKIGLEDLIKILNKQEKNKNKVLNLKDYQNNE